MKAHTGPPNFTPLVKTPHLSVEPEGKTARTQLQEDRGYRGTWETLPDSLNLGVGASPLQGA